MTYEMRLHDARIELDPRDSVHIGEPGESVSIVHAHRRVEFPELVIEVDYIPEPFASMIAFGQQRIAQLEAENRHMEAERLQLEMKLAGEVAPANNAWESTLREVRRSDDARQRALALAGEVDNLTHEVACLEYELKALRSQHQATFEAAFDQGALAAAVSHALARRAE